ncbi:MAG: hypothetical protein GX149_01295 [Acholeplasmataceae bacterium]|nr:hypothetical protein [Acholeplasmataceae bacterium]
MFKKIIGITITLLISFTLFGCKDELPKKDIINISFEELPISLETGEDLSVIIKTSEVLTLLLAENEWLSAVPAWLPEDTNRWVVFDDDFFANNVLIIHSEITNSVSISYSLENIQIVEGSLELNILGEYYGDTMYDTLGFAYFVVEVLKSNLQEIESFSVNKRYEQLDYNN